MILGTGLHPFLRMYLKESILEQVRVAEFPDKPSRLGGFFLRPTLDDIKKFRNAFPERQYAHICKIYRSVKATLDLNFVASPDSLLPIANLNEYIEAAR